MFSNSSSSPRRPLIAVGVVLAFVLVGCCVLSLAIGARPVPLATIVDALLHGGGGADGAVVRDSRVPRTLAGVTAGVGFGVAGALMQAVTRNPLAEPGLLGVNAGAAFAVICSVGLWGDRGAGWQVAVALAGAVVAALVVWVVGGRRGAADPARLALAGVALGAVLYGVGHGLALTDPQAFDRFRSWQLGTLDVRSLTAIEAAAPFVGTGVLIALSLGRGLDALALGDDAARSLGARLGVTRALAVVAVTLLAGSATAVVGAIGFVGLMVPHAARRLVGRDTRSVVVVSALGAPVLVLLADVVGRRVVPGELPVGVALACIGGPALVAIARGRRVRAL